MVNEDEVRRLALALPSVTERPSYGTPGFRVSDRLFARIRPEGDSVVVWCADLGEKEALLASDPDTFFTTPHYDGHPTVLVRMAAVDPGEMAELLTDSWRLRAPIKLVRAFDGGEAPRPGPTRPARGGGRDA